MMLVFRCVLASLYDGVSSVVYPSESRGGVEEGEREGEWEGEVYCIDVSYCRGQLVR